jgi:hypothetical protein
VFERRKANCRKSPDAKIGSHYFKCATKPKGAWIEQVVRGFFAYHAVPTNRAALKVFYHYVERIWLRTLRRRRPEGSLLVATY